MRMSADIPVEYKLPLHLSPRGRWIRESGRGGGGMGIESHGKGGSTEYNTSLLDRMVTSCSRLKLKAGRAGSGKDSRCDMNLALCGCTRVSGE